MVKRHIAGWRTTLVAGCVAAFAAMSPLIAAADQRPPCASGAVRELGGVSSHGQGRGHHCGGDDISFAALGGQADDDLSIAQVGEARPLVLPNTGGGPVDDQNPALPLAVVATAMALGAGGYLGGRRVRR